jgi:hypothetical protein
MPPYVPHTYSTARLGCTSFSPSITHYLTSVNMHIADHTRVYQVQQHKRHRYSTLPSVPSSTAAATTIKRSPMPPAGAPWDHVHPAHAHWHLGIFFPSGTFVSSCSVQSLHALWSPGMDSGCRCSRNVRVRNRRSGSGMKMQSCEVCDGIEPPQFWALHVRYIHRTRLIALLPHCNSTYK